MKDDSLGLNHLLSFDARCQTVTPRSSAVSSGHRSTAPPHSASGMPRCRWYHEANAALSPLLLRKTPPIPVIFAIVVPHPLSLTPTFCRKRLITVTAWPQPPVTRSTRHRDRARSTLVAGFAS